MRFLGLSVLLALAATAAAADDVTFVSPGEIKWEDAPPSLPPGAKMAILEGDLSKEVPFTIRAKVPDGYKIPKHTHAKIEHLTILSGAMLVTMEDMPPKKMTAGWFGFWQPGMKHSIAAEGETVIQVHGVGPWSIIYVNPADDPRNTGK